MRGDGLAGGAVAAANQHELGDSRVGGQRGAAGFQHGAAIRQAEAEFVKPHSTGCPRSHHNGSHGRQIHFFHGHTAPFTYV